LSLLVEYLVEKGASLTGTALLGGTGSPDEMADLIYDKIDRVPVESTDELIRLRQTTGRAVAGVTLKGVQPGGAGYDVQVRVLPIPENAVGRDRHPIAIWCDGVAFESDTTSTKKAKRAKEILDLFVSVVTDLSPAYGSILISWPLPSPADVAARPDGFEFADFYVSADYLGRITIGKIEQAIDEHHRFDLGSGTLFLTSGLFSSPPARNDDVGGRTARAIAAAGRARNFSE
jgi:hypothetical protein